MTIRIIALATALLLSGGTLADDELHARVAAILAETPLIDGHNDLPWQYRKRVEGRLEDMDFTSDLTGMEPQVHTDLPRLREGMMGGQFWSVYIPIREPGGAAGDASKVLEQIDIVYRLTAAHPSDLEMAFTAADVRRIHKQGKIASLIGIEGGHAIENSLGTLRQLYRVGARYMTLTHSKSLDWADSATDDERAGGLSEFGKEVVREMNRLGMLIDISHVSAKTMHDVLDTTAAPVIFSHSSVYAMTRHVRNVPDDVLRRLPDNGGVVMITFFPSYVSEEVKTYWNQRRAADALIDQETDDPEERERRYEAWRRDNPEPAPTLAQVADHIDYVRDLIGVEYLGVGGDYDGMPRGPDGLEDVSDYPALFVELLRRGYSDEEVAAIAGGNVLRAMEQAEAVARSSR